MRVIAGIAGGRPLKAVRGQATRPTTDKVKESIFSIIGPFFNGGTVLDLFAGTGALGIEALSRGMERAIFVDTSGQSLQTVRMNLQSTGFVAQAECYRNEAMRAIKTLSKRRIDVDLVFLDPPYRMNIITELLVELDNADILSRGSTLVCEHASDIQLPNRLDSQLNNVFVCTRRAVYGDTTVTIYHYMERSREEGTDEE